MLKTYRVRVKRVIVAYDTMDIEATNPASAERQAKVKALRMKDEDFVNNLSIDHEVTDITRY